MLETELDHGVESQKTEACHEMCSFFKFQVALFESYFSFLFSSIFLGTHSATYILKDQSSLTIAFFGTSMSAHHSRHTLVGTVHMLFGGCIIFFITKEMAKGEALQGFKAC